MFFERNVGTRQDSVSSEALINFSSKGDFFLSDKNDISPVFKMRRIGAFSLSLSLSFVEQKVQFNPAPSPRGDR